jgi:hypothetical protein
VTGSKTEDRKRIVMRDMSLKRKEEKYRQMEGQTQMPRLQLPEKWAA